MFQVTKGARRKGNLQKIEGLLPTGARDDNKKGAADLRRDIMKRRLRGDLIGDFLEIA
jgi:hypothetical protein